MNRAKWDRKQWGVVLSSPRSRPILLGALWAITRGPFYPGESTRPLLFNTREAARTWCRNKQAEYVGRNDVCPDWRFRAVRVRERVDVAA